MFEGVLPDGLYRSGNDTPEQVFAKSADRSGVKWKEVGESPVKGKTLSLFLVKTLKVHTVWDYLNSESAHVRGSGLGRGWGKMKHSEQEKAQKRARIQLSGK